MEEYLQGPYTTYEVLYALKVKSDKLKMYTINPTATTKMSNKKLQLIIQQRIEKESQNIFN